MSLFIFSATACGADLTFTWEPAVGEVWTFVRIYEKTGSTYTQVAQVDGTLTTVTVPGVSWGPHDYIARSVGVLTTGAELESPDSNTASTVVTPTSPKTLKVSRGQ
jgi:hypothetical protein